MGSDTTTRTIEIIQAAQGVFFEYGYKKVTMDDIAGRLDISRSALYYYYKNKEELFQAVLDFELQQYSAELNRQESNRGSSNARLMFLAGSCTRFRRNFSARYRLTGEDLYENTALIKEIKLKLIELHDNVIVKIIKDDHQFSDLADPQRAAHILSLAMRGVVFNTPDDDLLLLENELIYLCEIWYSGLKHMKLQN